MINEIDDIIYKNIDGINICFIQKKDYVEKEAMVAFNYGSINNTFIKDGKKITHPFGIAHFLEHKLFEDKEYNVFEVFNKYGGNVNAFTNFTTTAYYFSCVDYFEENLKELLKFVSRPYFTDENVEKEKGIIAQEINMYEDDPYWKVYFNLLDIMYSKNNSITKDIAGTIQDIEKIDKDMLYEVYNNFYTKDNSILIIAGDVKNFDNIEKLVCDNLKLKEKKSCNYSYFEEKNENNKLIVEKDMKIKQKILNIGFKQEEKYDKIEKQIIANKILLDIIFGTSSKFYEKLYNEKIIDNSFSFSFNSIANNNFSVFSAISSNPKKLLSYIKQELESFDHINKEDFERIKNKHISNFIKQFNFISNIVAMEAEFFYYGFNIKKYLECLKNIDIKDVSSLLNKLDKTCFLSIVS